MKTSIQFISILILLITNISMAQTGEYYNRLYYTCKVWGFLKYFHTEVAKGETNWDFKLITTITDIKRAASNEEFNTSIESLIYSAGEMKETSAPLPEVASSLKYNLNLSWIHNSVFSEDVESLLDTIKNRFRPQENYYVSSGSSGNTNFDNDIRYNNLKSLDEKQRLLSLFRYWNVINYFYPYKDIIDQDWDTTLVEFIPKFINAVQNEDYHLTFAELVTRINDSHTFTSSNVISNKLSGQYYLPLVLKYVEDKTLITKVLIDNTGIKVGDIITSINGLDINNLRNDLRKYAYGSNNPTVERNINRMLLHGSKKLVNISIKNSEGEIKNVSLNRNITPTNYSEMKKKNDSIWNILSYKTIKCGYVDMARLEEEQIDSMFSDLWDTDAIIFDIRNYPQGVVYYMTKYLFSKPIKFIKFTIPDITYPGTFYEVSQNIFEYGDKSEIYDKKIYLLFDEETQSHAEYTIMILEKNSNAVKIGSQTAGADGNVSSITLPGNIFTYFTGLGVYYPDGTATQRVGIVPDIEVHPTIEGIREGRDELVERALEECVITSVSKDDEIASIVSSPVLYQNYPNPFNSSTIIEYQIPEYSHVSLKIFDVLGKEVVTLVNKDQQKGRYSVEFNAEKLSSGLYFYTLINGNFIETKKIILLK